jgi:MFS superfamily sulfate permease-like transporter
MNPSKPAHGSAPAPEGNRYDLREWAGAFGDLGTLLPFVMAYLSVLHLDPFGVLFGFGVSMVVCGAWFKTPMPVQPMKAIGAVAVGQTAQTAALTAGVIQGASLATGLLWLLLGATGIARQLGRWVSAPVAQGMMVGLALAFMWQGVQQMRQAWLLALAGLLLVGLLARTSRFPGIFALLLLGLGWTVCQQPEALAALGGIGLQWRWPSLAWPTLSMQDLLLGAVLLALPQAPLTLGNAVIGIRAENNRLFPARPVSERTMALSTGVMNLFGSAVGAVPMCHGAGGMAGHVAFGARTGGSMVILGALLLVLALGFSESVLTIFALVPAAVLGTVLVVTGSQLGLGQLRLARTHRAWVVLGATAAVSIWHVAAGMAVGLLLQQSLPGRTPADGGPG